MRKKGAENVLEQGSLVIYGIHGLCRIVKREVMTVDRKNKEYFVLEPIKQPGASYYVPIQNPAAVAKLRPILTKQQLDELLASLEAASDSWISDENTRKQCYRELINSGDRAALISMVKSIHMHKEKQQLLGRKLHLCDENFLRDAQNLLSTEFSIVLGIEPEAVGDYIKNAIL